MRIFFLVAFLAPVLCSGQDYVTPDQYAFTVESDVPYGVDTNYLGLVDSLLLDVYHPTGNPDDQRPLMVFVHGGSWLGGCKDHPGVLPLIHQFVKRGYVVASVNYRLGWHKDDFVPGAVAGDQPSPWPPLYRALYALDSLEMKRAIYRGMQDVKGAIRYMKDRAEQDSVCVEKVFLAGESAGGFVALAAAFLDDAVERPYWSFEIQDALPPDPDVANTTELNCISETFSVDPMMLTRPDLGGVGGHLNLNGFDASVQGVANFFGGLPVDAFTLDWFQGLDTPSVYMYHQSCDGIVLFNRGRPFRTISANCNLGATPWHTNYPEFLGSGAIAMAFDTMTVPPNYITDFTTCAPFDPNLALLECIRYADNGSYHFIADHAMRGANLSSWWAPVAADSTICSNTLSIADLPTLEGLVAYPIPASDFVRLDGGSNADVVVISLLGKRTLEKSLENGQLDVSDLPDGSYFVRFINEPARVARIVVLH